MKDRQRQGSWACGSVEWWSGSELFIFRVGQRHGRHLHLLGGLYLAVHDDGTWQWRHWDRDGWKSV